MIDYMKSFNKYSEIQEAFDELFIMAVEESEDFEEENQDAILEELSYVSDEDLESIYSLAQVDEKMSIADAIQAKKQKRKRMRTAEGKMAKRKLERKMARSSYRPDKKRSRVAKKGARIRRNIPGAGV